MRYLNTARFKLNIICFHRCQHFCCLDDEIQFVENVEKVNLEKFTYLSTIYIAFAEAYAFFSFVFVLCLHFYIKFVNFFLSLC